MVKLGYREVVKFALGEIARNVTMDVATHVFTPQILRLCCHYLILACLTWLLLRSGSTYVIAHIPILIHIHIHTHHIYVYIMLIYISYIFYMILCKLNVSKPHIMVITTLFSKYWLPEVKYIPQTQHAIKDRQAPLDKSSITVYT